MSNNTIVLPQFPAYPAGSEQARQDAAVVAVIVMTFIGLACVGLRIYTRAILIRKMGIEDWTIVAATLLAVTYALQLLVAAKYYKLGFGGSSLSEVQTVETMKQGLAQIAVYKTTVTLIKASILMFYLRFPVNKTFARVCKGSILLLLTYQSIVIIIIPLECMPLSKMWDFTGTAPGHCINTPVFYYITSAFHILMDIWVLVLPCRLIFTIPRPTREKIAVYMIFGLGAFSTLCAIIRFHFLVVALTSKDPSYDALGIAVASIIEVNIGIVCASMPTLRPLLTKATRNLAKEAHVTEDYVNSTRKRKRHGLLSVKEMFITLGTMTVGTFKTSKGAAYDEESCYDIPPPVPPKDEKCAPKVSYPTMVYYKI